MATIDATLGGVSSNSYISLDDADAHFADTLREADWSQYSADDRSRGLIQATRQIEGMDLRGVPDDTDQALHFPRSHDYDADGNLEMPEYIERAVCEQALWLLNRRDAPPLLDRGALQAEGVASVSLDGVSEAYTGHVADGWCPEARGLLRVCIRRTGSIETRGAR